MTTRTASVVVVGGGLLGCAAAFHLAQSGVQTTLIERDGVGAHASSNNPGNLNPFLGTPPALVELARQSFALHRAWAEELSERCSTDYELRPVRRILLAFDETERLDLKRTACSFADVDGFSASSIDADALFRREPGLSRRACAGLLLEGNLSVNSRAMNRALAEGAARCGATLMRRQVVGIKRHASRIVGVHTPEGLVAGDAVVFATGAWVGPPEKWLNFDSQVTPLKGEMLRMKLPGPGLDHDVTRGLISLYRRSGDECWVGVTQQSCGLDETPSEAGRHQLLAGAESIFPTIRQATLLEHVASVRPVCRSGLPVVGRVPGWDNAYIVNGGGSKGVLLCTGLGMAISELMRTGATRLSVDAFSPQAASENSQTRA